MVVCRAAQENRARANYVGIFKGTTKSRFSRIHNSMIFYLKNTKVAVEVPTNQGRLHNKFEENRVKCFRDMSEQTFKFVSSFFRLLHIWKNHCNLQTRTPIQLKFGTLVGCPEAIININFGENPYKILIDIIHHLRKTSTIFRQTYRVTADWISLKIGI